MAMKIDPEMGKFLGYGSQLAAGAVLGYLVGRWIDEKFNCKPYGMLISVTLGLTSGMYLLIRDGIRANKD